MDKAMRLAAPRPSAARGRGRGSRVSVRCFACDQFGHYQSYCPYRQTGNQAKKGRFSGGLREHPELWDEIRTYHDGRMNNVFSGMHK